MAWTLPLPEIGRIIGRPFQGTHTRGNWESDNAVDIAVPVGTPVYAVEAGKIGARIGLLSSSEAALAGNRVNLAGGSGNNYYYAHLSRYVVLPGQTVKAGQLLGYSGSANGVAHLHFAVEQGDPQALIGVGSADGQQAAGSSGSGSEVSAAGVGCLVVAIAQAAAVIGVALAGVAWFT